MQDFMNAENLQISSTLTRSDAVKVLTAAPGLLQIGAVWPSQGQHCGNAVHFHSFQGLYLTWSYSEKKVGH